MSFLLTRSRSIFFQPPFTHSLHINLSSYYDCPSFLPTLSQIISFSFLSCLFLKHSTIAPVLCLILAHLGREISIGRPSTDTLYHWNYLFSAYTLIRSVGSERLLDMVPGKNKHNEDQALELVGMNRTGTTGKGLIWARGISSS